MDVQGQPTWCGEEGRPVAAWVLRPEEGRARGVVVLAPTVGREAVGSARAMNALGVALARAGLVSIYFDWRGNANSASLDGDDVVGQWLEDLDAAHTLAQEVGGGLPVHVVGLRLGATLVHRWGRETSGQTVLWEPVAGRRFLRQQQRLRVLSVPLPPEPAEAGVELCGMFFTPAQAKGLGALKAPKADQELPDRVCVRLEDDRTVAEQLYFSSPRYSRIPYQAIDEIVGMLGEGSVHDLPPWTPRTTAAFAVDGHMVRETFVPVGPDRLHGILTGSVTETASEALVFTSAGSEALEGPVGLWATAARQAAVHGAVSLRAERRGLGFHLDVREPREPVPYTEDAVLDVVHAVRHVRGLTEGPVRGVGLCVGAWLFLRAAAVERLDSVLAFDNVVWQSDPRWVARLLREPFLRRFLVTSSAPDVEDLLGDDAAPVAGGPSGPGVRERIKDALKAVRDVSRRRPLIVRGRLASMGRAEFPYEILSRVPRSTEVKLVFGQAAWRHLVEVHGEEALSRLRALGYAVEVSQWADLDHSLLATSARRRTLALIVADLGGGTS